MTCKINGSSTKQATVMTSENAEVKKQKLTQPQKCFVMLKATISKI